jgi:hypothetical protein
LLVSFTEKKEFVVCVGEKGNETTIRTTTYIVQRCNFEMRRLFARRLISCDDAMSGFSFH